MLVDPTTTTFVLPRYFGSRRWSVPTGEIGLVDLGVPPVSDPAEPWEFDDPFREVHLWSGAKGQRATTELRLRQPVRVPPIRVWAHDRNGIRWWDSRSADGVHLDAVRLTFVDPAAAHRTLLAHGAEAVADRDGWWRRWRATRPVDQIEVDGMIAALQAHRRTIFMAVALVSVAAVLAGLARLRDDLWPLVPAVATVVGGRLLMAWSGRRLARRREQLADDSRRRHGGGTRPGPPPR